MTPFLVRTQDSLYDCFAVSNHSGSYAAGHYTAHAKSPLSGAWYSYNDSHVSPFGDASLLETDPLAYNAAVEQLLQTSSAYVLMYRRRGTEPYSAVETLRDLWSPSPESPVSSLPSASPTALSPRSQRSADASDSSPEKGEVGVDEVDVEVAEDDEEEDDDEGEQGDVSSGLASEDEAANTQAAAETLLEDANRAPGGLRRRPAAY